MHILRQTKAASSPRSISVKNFGTTETKELTQCVSVTKQSESIDLQLISDVFSAHAVFL